jgi:thymidylate kinase
MGSMIKSAVELKHPGFIVFEGLDFSGKTSLAKKATEALKTDPHFKLVSAYNHNHGFLNRDLVDEAHMKSLSPDHRVDYLIERYSRDILPSDPRQFSEIFQDRHLPYLIFYAVTKCGRRIEDVVSRMKEFTKPKHIFLIECSYEESRRRALKRSHTTENEMATVSSKEAHKDLRELYRCIITALGIPSTIIDTSAHIPVSEYLHNFLDKLRDSNALAHDVVLDDLVVDHDPRVFKSTARFKLENTSHGKKYSPISVIRVIDGDLNYINAILDGKHRAYAALNAGHKTISAYISYKPVSNIDLSSLKRVGEFGFK